MSVQDKLSMQGNSGRQGIGAVLLGATEIVAAASLAIALLSPAQAQFWSPFAPARRPPAPVQQPVQPQQQQQNYNPFGGFFAPEQRPVAPADNSHAPSPQQRK